MALVGIHDALEHAAQHVRRDEFAGIVLAHGEVEALEQIVEGLPPIGVAPYRGPMRPLEARRLEQTAVEEGDVAQSARRAAAGGWRPIQGAEAQRVEERAMKVAAGGERAVEQPRDVTGVAVQPALRLNEIEEEHARQRGQRQGVTIEARAWRAQPLSQPIQRAPKCSKEARRDAFARQDFPDS